MANDGRAPLFRERLLGDLASRDGAGDLAAELARLNKAPPGLERFEAVTSAFGALADKAPDLCGRAIAGVISSGESVGVKARLSLAAIAGARHHRAVAAVALKLFSEGLSGRDAPVFADEAQLQVGAFCPPDARIGVQARPYLAVIAAAEAAGFDELSDALAIIMRPRVRPIRAGGPAWRRMRRAHVAGLKTRDCLHRTGGALSRLGFDAPHGRARVQFARKFPYLQDDRPGPFRRRLLLLNRYPGLTDPDIRFVYNNSNFPHTYATTGAPDDLALDALLIGALDFDAIIDRIEPPDVIYNNLASAEAMETEGGGGLIHRLADHFGARLINPPERIAEVSRDANWRRIGARDHAIFPRTVRFPAGFDVEKTVAEIAADFTWPVIVRDPLRHMGADMTLAGDAGEARRALSALTSSGAYAIQFHDFADGNGYYSKHRVFKIGEDISYARLHCGEDWNVHIADHDKLAKARPDIDFEARRARLRKDPLSELSEPLWNEVCDLLRETGLDMVGVDFGVMPDGRALIFEMNPAMRTPDFGQAAFAELIGLN